MSMELSGSNGVTFPNGINASTDCLLGANGYQKLPSGLIIQWGIAVSVTANSVYSVSYPVAFPSAICSLVATVQGDQTTSAISNLGSIKTNNIGNSSFTMVYSDDVTAQAIHWIAIGY